MTNGPANECKPDLEWKRTRLREQEGDFAGNLNLG